MHRRALLACGLILAAAGWTSWPHAEAMAQPGLEILEPVYAVIATPAGLMIRVASRGCTTKPDFTFYVSRKPEGVSVAFGRRSAETCKPTKAPGHVDLTFSYAELGVGADTPLSVLNPIVAAPLPQAHKSDRQILPHRGRGTAKRWRGPRRR
jgi:hypothetical protein